MPMTCISCHVAFANTELQREHYKSDWHRYNIMRKVAELSPVTSEDFEQRARLLRESTGEEQTEGFHCQICRKYFSSKNAFDNHLKSKRHLESLLNRPQEANLPLAVQEKNRRNVVKSLEATIEDLTLEDDEDEDSDWESVADDSFDVTKCLFCSLESEGLESNVKHMSTSHSFFLPDLEYLTDLPGLIAYLGNKCSDCYTCLWCDKVFHSKDAVQKHMADKGHGKMHFESQALLEYASYYDYTSSYPDDGSEEVPDLSLDGECWQLVLPSGATVGHRSLSRYYNQNLRPERPGGHGRSHKAIHRLMHEYRSLGWRETPERVAQRNALDLRFMKKVMAKQQLRLGQKANKLQPHFRPQVVF